MQARKLWNICVVIGLLGMAAWVIYEAVNGRYFEAIAASGVASVFAWLATNRGQTLGETEDDPPNS